MKRLPINFLKTLWILLPAIAILAVTSCGDDDPIDPMTADPIASFQFEPDATDFLTVAFNNFSTGASTYAWDFGDGGTSADENPTYTYASGGTYDVTLTASNAAGTSAMKTETIIITDPNSATRILTGDVSKTWRLFREGTSMSLGPNAAEPALYWAGLTNDGARPCAYFQEFTFGSDGSFTFDDKGEFWAEFGVFSNTAAGCTDNTVPEQCFEAIPANMRNECNDDVSAWLSGTHQFDYDPSTGELTLTGDGAWIGIPKLTTAGETIVPVNVTTAKISFEEFTGYDVMLVEFDYGGAYWPIRYASYTDSSLEPDVVTGGPPPFGEDYDDISPTELYRGFASTDASDFILLDTIPSGSTVEYGVDDPADATAAKVGQFNRTDAQFQELQFQTSPTKNDINFENLTSVTIDVYFPSSNDYSGALTQFVIVGLADASNTEQWWTDQMEYHFDGEAMGLATDEWHTLTVNLDSPSYVAMTGTATTPQGRNDYDMIYVQIGSGNHNETGTFYVRNLRFQ